jgi:hypothetical protein
VEAEDPKKRFLTPFPTPKITDASVETLTGLKQLQRLDLRSTRITAKGAAQLQAALPNCDVQWWFADTHDSF